MEKLTQNLTQEIRHPRKKLLLGQIVRLDKTYLLKNSQGLHTVPQEWAAKQVAYAIIHNKV